MLTRTIPRMKMPNLPPSLVTWLSGLVAQYISSQRVKYLPIAEPLSRQQKAAMTGFFTPELLDETRLLVLIGERIVNPHFYPVATCRRFHKFTRSMDDDRYYA